MSRSTFSSWFPFAVSYKKTKKTSAAPARGNRTTGRRVLRMEQLECREMLSASIAAVPAGAAAHAAAAAVAPSPTINNVVASATLGKLTWSAADPSGVASAGLTVGGTAVTDVGGPWTAATGLNYSWTYNTLAPGAYAYVITATDVLGNASQYTGTLVVGSNAGPTVSKAVAAPGQGVITWNATVATGGATSCTLTLDGSAVTSVYGPWAASSGETFEAVIGTVADGCHSYVITATDAAGNTSQYTSWFVSGTSTPTINNVVLSANQGTITWNAAAVTGIKAAALTIDGAAVSGVSGPWDAASGENYQGTFSGLASGTHTYTITVTSGGGVTTKSVGVFTVSGPTIGSIVVSVATGSLTWNAASSNGVASATLTIDGAGVGVCGPYAAAYGYNFSGALGVLAIGSHTYVISTTDNSGRFAQYSGVFQITSIPPTISQVAVSVAKGLITWNADDSDGVQTVSVTIDGVAKKILCPFKSSSGFNYEGVFSGLAAGNHTFIIRAVDTVGNASQYSGTFLV